MTSVIMKVEGMSCEHCSAAITRAVKALDGVSKVEVDLKSKTVEVEFDPAKLNADAIKAAIEDQGYDVLG
ncbi:MAG: copper chaperone CopZ [Clostridiales bacterium]|jgi:copper chaperone|nr:copper chaperone CopZ [Clostridiales bacterium]HOA33522.1 copper chaperone CopZ [Clostridiales bacterium]HOJ35845.1 copper chaperone CopZ [Clostridiales bacterium]HOL79459.1 copper chaperone CopZ [Clostridiales bacterium]HPP68288.1 copper chaperone CopZ [Clostridiales bacterium]